MEITEAYLGYLRSKLGDCEEEGRKVTREHLSVGIVGAGISGLYCALLLQRHVPNVKVKLYEANDRVGGRIFTYKFSDEPYQYGEAGAMRIPTPTSGNPSPVIQLIEYLNKSESGCCLKLIDFVNSCPSGNRVFVNGTTMKDGRVMNVEYADAHCSELGFSGGIKDEDQVNKLLVEALQPVISDLKNNFEGAVSKYEHVSLQQYLKDEAGWNDEKISYYELLLTMTNASHSGLLDAIIPFVLIFSSDSQWKTIDGGMSKLPQECASLVHRRGGEISLNTKVESVAYCDDQIKLGFKTQSSGCIGYENFDAVIFAIPTPCIRSLERPHWPAKVEYALRSLQHWPVLKVMLRFKSRFWESSSLMHAPSFGGMSVTDLPIRRIFYPPYGMGRSDKGILMAFVYKDDAMPLLALSDSEKVRIILRDLQKLYPEVVVAKEYAGGTDPNTEEFLREAIAVDWTTRWPMGGAALYFPGQLIQLYPLLAQNRDNIYFAGDHLSSWTQFIVGALESSRFAVQQLVHRQYSRDVSVEYLNLNSS